MEFQTNTTVTETHVQVNLRWDPGYVKTLPGAIKSVVIVSMKSREKYFLKTLSYQLTNLLGFVCVMVATPYYKEQPVGEWFVFVSMTGFWVSSVLLVMYLVHAMEKFHVIPWLMIEFGFCALWTFFFFAAALAAAVEVTINPSLYSQLIDTPCCRVPTARSSEPPPSSGLCRCWCTGWTPCSSSAAGGRASWPRARGRSRKHSPRQQYAGGTEH